MRSLFEEYGKLIVYVLVMAIVFNMYSNLGGLNIKSSSILESGLNYTEVRVVTYKED